MDCRQGFIVYEISLAASIRSNSLAYIVVTLCDCCEPTRCPRLDEHRRYLGAVASQLALEEGRAQSRHVLGYGGGNSIFCFLYNTSE